MFGYRRKAAAVAGLLRRSESHLTKVDLANVEELIKDRELELAFEIMCDQIFEHEKPLTPEHFSEISEVGRLLLIPESLWDFLRELVGPDPLP